VNAACHYQAKLLYEYKINIEPKLGRRRHTFLKQISSYLSRNAGHAKKKKDWKQLLFAAPNPAVL
jgi:hypothetical protein